MVGGCSPPRMGCFAATKALSGGVAVLAGPVGLRPAGLVLILLVNTASTRGTVKTGCRRSCLGAMLLACCRVILLCRCPAPIVSLGVVPLIALTCCSLPSGRDSWVCTLGCSSILHIGVSPVASAGVVVLRVVWAWVRGSMCATRLAVLRIGSGASALPVRAFGCRPV